MQKISKHSWCGALILVIALWWTAPLLVQADQITPNPNPAGSTIDIINDPFAVNNDNPYSNGGTINIDASSTLTNSVGALLSNIDPTTHNDGGTLNNAGTLINNGYLNNSNGRGDGLLTNTGTLTNAGTLELNGLGGPGQLLNQTGGTLTNTGSLVIVDNGTLTNAGLLTNSGSISGTGSYEQTAGQTVNNGTLSLESFIDINGGLLSGTGTLTGPVTIGSGATVSPGNSPGTLTMNGTFASSGHTLFEIGGLGAGQFDVLNINGNAIFTGGTSRFNFMNFTPVVGNSWDFLYADSITGWDTLSFLFSGLGTSQTAEFSYANGVETLRIASASVPEPSALLL